MPPTAKSFPPRSNFCVGGRRFYACKAAASSDLNDARFQVVSLGVQAFRRLGFRVKPRHATGWKIDGRRNLCIT